MNHLSKKNIIIFASGNGSNFKNIHQKVKADEINGTIKLLVSNNGKSGAIEYAVNEKIPIFIHNRNLYPDPDEYSQALVKALKEKNAELLLLAGYMKKIPQKVVDKYLGRILNIHPSLLPKFGGKGFYGIKVHEAVINSKEQQTGITIHLVDHDYDTGNIIYQEKIDVLRTDSPVSLGKRVLELEHKNYPKVISHFCEKYKKETND